MVIHKENVSPLVTAFELAKNTKRNIYQNLTISLTYNSAITLLASGLLLTIGFTLNPIVGVMCMIGESSIILANLYRLKQQKINSLSDFTRNTRFSNSSCEILHTLTASKSIHAEKKVAFQSPVEGPALFAKPLELATAACVRDQGPMSLDDVALKHSIHIHSFPIHRDIHRKCG